MRNIVLLLTILLFSALAFANNASYIAISNDIAKQIHLEVVANNAANIHTIGFEQDDVIYKEVTKKETKNKTNTFVVPRGNYRKNEVGGLKVTNNPLDLAIIGKGYFKILTPRGPRYSLAGNFLINGENILVNPLGYPVASPAGQVILMPEKSEYKSLYVAPDGTIYADNNQIDIVGIFDFPPSVILTKEGGNLYASNKNDIILDAGGSSTIQSGSLRTSNVNSTKVLTNMIELERSAESSRQLVNDLANLERNSVARIMK